MIHNTKIQKVSKLSIPDPEFGDIRLSVFPFEHTGQFINLPSGFEIWNDSFNKILQQIPLQEGANQHYITIDSKFFSKSDFLRREGVHADGNFCVDPNFRSSTWGGTSPTWGGVEPSEPKETWGGVKPTWGGTNILKLIPKPDNSHVKMDWVLPYDLMIPVGDYISYDKGGIFCIATEFGCQGWEGEFYGEVGPEGDFSQMCNQLTDDKKVLFEKDTLYFMTSNTPHETLYIEKGNRRTLIRITLNHEYKNSQLPCMKNKTLSF